MEHLKNVQDTYTKFHAIKNPVNVYPAEWVIRTLQGSYPDMSLDKTLYAGSKILDVGFGDGRNMPLLHNLKFDIYGVEISEEIVKLTQERLQSNGIQAILKVGSNADLPFEDNTFDYILASSSWYYVDEGTTFEDNMREYARVLKPGGIIMATLGHERSFIFDKAEPLENGHVIVRNDIYGLRNGYIMRCFKDKEEVKECLGIHFENFAIGHQLDDYYGVTNSLYLVVCNKKK